MASDYALIKAENERSYGTDISRIGKMLFADRYAIRTHFIFELLQNAEDALARRDGWKGSREVVFELSETSLRVSHFGTLFTEADVRSICGIDESTKKLNSIGRFGIGFKSVYAFTDHPEVHSGDEHFAIDSYVWPKAVQAIDVKQGETVFLFPLRPSDPLARVEIASGMQGLGPRTLLFLKEIEEISWAVEGGVSGQYLRSKPEKVSENANKVIVIGEEYGASKVIEETWLIFSREVRKHSGAAAGFVEVAFALNEKDDGDSLLVRPIDDSVLVVFFPTIVPINLGFLIQGPYCTTPSRDNVPLDHSWNQYLVQETATLLAEALRTLRDLDLLDVGALRSLPLDESKFGEECMFAPLFEKVRDVLYSEPLLPVFDGGFVAAQNARLARTQELRELLNPTQLATAFQTDHELAWICAEITQDRTPELRQYLMQKLDIPEVTPETILQKLTESFLLAQSDDWIVQLYEFLLDQPALVRKRQLVDIPLIRLEDGRHVTPYADNLPQAYLPGPVVTGFPTVKKAICRHSKARELLTQLGLTEPDLVDDIVRNVLPKYAGEEVDVSDAEYESDIQKILMAFRTDSQSQREKLVKELRDTSFVMAVDVGDESKWISKPDELYLTSQRIKAIFEGVPNVLFVDDDYPCLRGEDIRALLEACGASRYLQPIQTESNFTPQERREMRKREGTADISGTDEIEDYTLRGLDQLLDIFLTLDAEVAIKKAGLLWEALCDLEDRRGVRAFSGTNRWHYVSPRKCYFDAAFVRKLNEKSWVPDSNGTLQPPGLVVFKETGWKESPTLLSKIRFKPLIIEILAREAGIEPGLLDLLKKIGITSEAELKNRLGIQDESLETEKEPAPANLSLVEALAKMGIEDPSTPSVKVGSSKVLASPEGSGGTGFGSTIGHGTGHAGTSHEGIGSIDISQRESTTRRTSGDDHHRSQSSLGGHSFFSYIGVHPDEDRPDPDGLEHKQRLALEEQAIKQILKLEPKLKRTPTNNPGFDLVEPGPDGKATRWVEVKAMTSEMRSRPVGLTRIQFESAQEHGDAYWLYIVEHATSPKNVRIVRIQDPAGKAQTFTFDHGWLSAATVTPTPESRK